MKISIRWKYFLVLLAFSLVPMIMLRNFIGSAGTTIVGEVTERTRQDVGDLIQLGLVSSVISSADVLESEGAAVSLAASQLSLLTETLLQGAIASQAQPYTILTRQMRMQPAPGLSVEGRYFKQTPSGRKKPLSVDMNRVAILPPLGMSDQEVTQHAEALSALYPVMKEIYERIDPYWLHVDLDSGIRVVYPAHQGYPMMYDPRLTGWYKRAVESNEPTWSSPVVDPVSRQLLGTVSNAIHDSDGNVIGVAAVDVPLADLLQEHRLKAEWGESQTTFLTIRHPDQAENNSTGLLIVAQRGYENGHASWHMNIEHEWLSSSDTKAFLEFTKLVDTQESGLMEMPYKGVPSIWAFASKPDFSFIVVLPTRTLDIYPQRISNSVNSIFNNLRKVSHVGILAVVGLVGIFAYLWSRKSTQPLLKIARAGRRLSEGDFSTRIDFRFNDERDMLVDSFNNLGPKLSEYMAIRRDLELASTVQDLLLPSGSPDLPGFEIAGSLIYSDQTGGDYFDFLPVMGKEGPAFAVVVGDVTGHGMQAALLMATARALLHGLSGAQLELGKRMNLMNRNLSEDLEGTGRFMTMFYLQLAEGSNAVRWVRAGHDPAFRLKDGCDDFEELKGEGLPLGVDPDMEYLPCSTELEQGEMLVLATDGIWEAHSPSGEMFGKERLLAIIRQNRDNSAEEIVRRVLEAVSQFAASRLDDDMTMVVVRRTSESGD